MALIVPTSTTTDSTAITLPYGDGAVIRPAVNIISRQTAGIVGAGENHAVTVFGTVFGRNYGISLGSETSFFNSVEVGANGHVGATSQALGYTVGVSVLGAAGRVVNAGVISGTVGIVVGGSDPISAMIPSYITNTGVINGMVGRHIDSLNGVIVQNAGTMSNAHYFYDSAAFLSSDDSPGVDSIFNTGTIIGDIRLGGGDDLFDGRGGKHVGMVYGGPGNDTLRAGDDGAELVGEAGDDLLVGGAGDDTLRGGADNDTLRGRAGDDELYGWEGDDLLFGGPGDDLLHGQAGNDTLDGGGGNNTLTGGAGTDIFVFRRVDSADVITDFERGIDLLDLSALGFRNFAAVEAVASAARGGRLFLDFTDQGGGTVLITGLSLAQFDNSDVIL